MGPLGITEILVILLIVMLLFGAKKIPELMKGVGKGMREFNDAKNKAIEEINAAPEDVRSPQAAQVIK